MYGIKNCDTIKKARKWLDENGVEYNYHDFKKDAPNEKLLTLWVDVLGLETLVNKRGTTYRKLSDDEKSRIADKASAIEIMLKNSSIIKRPILDIGQKHIVGFDLEEYKKLV